MQVAISLSFDFLRCFRNLDNSVGRRVEKFLKTYPANPKKSGYNFEKIANASHNRLRSVRISDKYRAILQMPAKGNTILALWVDNHDEAYDWARRHSAHIHPDTGTLQVVKNPVVRSVQPEEHPPKEDRKLLFHSYRNRQLRRIGVPEKLLPLVKSLADVDDLDAHKEDLPADCYEHLVLLADPDISYAQVERNIEVPKKKVDTEDVESALALPSTKRLFVRINDEIVAEALEGTLETWRVFLHPEQRRLVEMNVSGPVRVLGGAGTGKTVVAMHRARWLARKIFAGPRDRILLLTYNTNLAADIQKQLCKICTPEELTRIDVKTIDGWAIRHLYKMGESFTPIYRDRGFARKAWDQARAELPAHAPWKSAWLKDEYYAVIVHNGITTEQEYLKVSRAGRGSRLGQVQRRLLWHCFGYFQEALKAKTLLESQDIYRKLTAYIKDGKSVGQYRSVLVDEVQDMGRAALQLIRAIVPEGPNDLFVVGDPHQRIYGRPVVLSHAGINIMGRGRRLRLNYRTPEEVRKWATAVLRGEAYDDLDGGDNSQTGERSVIRGTQPKVLHLETRDDELAAIIDHIKSLGCGANLHTVCLVARLYSLRRRYKEGLEKAGIPTYVLGKGADNITQPGVRIGTMHRVKGLEYHHVIAAGVRSGQMPLRQSESSLDKVARSHVRKQERSLLYVVATRAKKSLLVTGYGKKSEFLAELETELGTDLAISS